MSHHTRKPIINFHSNMKAYKIARNVSKIIYFEQTKDNFIVFKRAGVCYFKVNFLRPILLIKSLDITVKILC